MMPRFAKLLFVAAVVVFGHGVSAAPVDQLDLVTAATSLGESLLYRTSARSPMIVAGCVQSFWTDIVDHTGNVTKMALDHSYKASSIYTALRSCGKTSSGLVGGLKCRIGVLIAKYPDVWIIFEQVNNFIRNVYKTVEKIRQCVTDEKIKLALPPPGTEPKPEGEQEQPNKQPEPSNPQPEPSNPQPEEKVPETVNPQPEAKIPESSKDATAL